MKQSTSSLVSDEPRIEANVDLITNGSYVQSLAATINETACKASFAVGIFSSWGTGKTDFLMRLKNILEKNPQENIILDFNPWKAATTETILGDFFTELAGALRPYNKSVTGELKKYSRKILSSSEEIQYKMANAFLDEWIKEPTLKERYDTINSAITETGKRLIVFVDDLDRLTGQEVLQVLRVIRNSANFTNTFFIVALDHQYIIEVLKHTSLFSREEQYLKKIFQLVITLPQIRKQTFHAEILKYLTYEGMPPEDKDKIESTLAKLKFNDLSLIGLYFKSARQEGFLEAVLDNYRDVKRFCNSFKINFNILKNEVETIDLFLIELIKTKSFYTYELIANKQLLSIGKNSPLRFELNTDAWEVHTQKSQLDEYSMENIKSVIELLLGSNNTKGSRQFSYPHNFYLYFCFQLFDLISLNEFINAVSMHPKEMRQKFDEWIIQGKQNDLTWILNGFADYKDADEFERLLKAYLLGKDGNDLVSRAIQMIMNVEENIHNYFNNKKENYQSFTRSILRDDTLPQYNRASVASALLKHSIYNSIDLILPKAEVQEIIYNLFDKYLQNKRCYDEDVDSFYIFNDDTRDNNLIILQPRAHKRMFEFLSSQEENFGSYLRFLIRSRSLPTNGEFVFGPFAKEIFGEWTVFQTMVQDFMPVDEHMQRLKQIIFEHIKDYVDGKDRFRLVGEDMDFVLAHLRSTKQYPFNS